LELYSKIYGKVDVTNKEFMLWLVKGNITKQMGFEVDWASVAASTTYVLACRLESDLLKRDLTPEETETLACLAPTPLQNPLDLSPYTLFGAMAFEKKESRNQSVVLDPLGYRLAR
jgi:hypothetical protein